MFDEFKTVVLNRNIDAFCLKTGSIGTVVHVYNNGEAYEVEFVKDNGETIAVLTLTSADIRSMDSSAAHDFKLDNKSEYQNIINTKSSSESSKTERFYRDYNFL